MTVREKANMAMTILPPLVIVTAFLIVGSIDNRMDIVSMEKKLAAANVTITDNQYELECLRMRLDQLSPPGASRSYVMSDSDKKYRVITSSACSFDKDDK